MLPLTEVKQRHNSRLLILRGIAFEDLGNKFLINGIELEGYGRVVVVCVTVLTMKRSVAE